MLSAFVYRNGETRPVDTVDPQWLVPSSGVSVWVDLFDPTPEEGRILSDVFHLHPLAVEDALSAVQFPKIEAYPEYLYLVLHGLDVSVPGEQLATHDIDFFLAPRFLITVHGSRSRSIDMLASMCTRHHHVLAEGPVALMHRIIDRMVDNYRPAVEGLGDRLTDLEEEAFLGHESLVRDVLTLKRELGWMRRVMVPQRDAVARLARREFPLISDEMAYRFRDVFDHLVRISEETVLFQERVTSILEVNLATVSNRLNQVMKVLTVMSTIFLPLTVLTGMWGMNIPLPHLPGGPSAQFWWISGIMASIIASMLVLFRRRRWI